MHWWKRSDILKLFLLGILGFCNALCNPLLGQSVLASGDFYQIAITKTGVYKLEAAFLRKIGIPVSEINPAQIQIFGAGGKMLPQLSSALNPGKLTESPIWVQGAEDGRFDSNDLVCFYAEGPHTIAFDSVSKALRHQLNFYSDTTYYYLTFGQNTGKRILNATHPATGGQLINDFDDYWFHENESVNILKSGRDWWGEYLGNTAFAVESSIPYLVPGSEMIVSGSAMGAAQVRTSFRWQLNGTELGETQIGTVGAGTYDVKGLRSNFSQRVPAGQAPPQSFRIGVSHQKNGQNGALAYLDYFSIQTKRQLRFFEEQQIYHFLPKNGNTATYQFAGTGSGYLVWNIKNASNPQAVTGTTSSGNFTFNAVSDFSPDKFIAFQPNNAWVPAGGRKIPNQNIQAQQTPELLIITPAAWDAEARRLAAYRNEHDQLETLVVHTSQIYNEFSGGKADATAIRNYVRYLYQKQPQKLKYLLLFGDASFDYKNLSKSQSAAQVANYVPVYESRESLSPVYTYSSDDYFGFLEMNEGDWAESTAGDHTLDIGVGRLPVKTKAEAKTVVDKLLHYESAPVQGTWKNKILFIADDGDGNIHQRHADQLAKMVQPEFLPQRIFIDEFPQSTTSEGQKAPDVNAAIRNGINNGALIVNYTGHGGVSGWAEEQILTLNDMLSVRGKDNMPLLFTATCDFGRYDDHGAVSGAEIMVLSPRGAAIGAISTTRPVFSSTNFTLSKAFYEALEAKAPGSRLGDLFRQTKNNALVGSLNRNFTLLADPTQQLFPTKNAIRWTSGPDTLRAREKVVLAGEVFDRENNAVATDFTGEARIVIYDKPVAFETRGNEGSPENYTDFRSRLFEGGVSVTNGKFVCEFVVPKDIDYRLGEGRADIYAINSMSIGAAGQLPLTIGGSGAVSDDNIPPRVSAFLNDESFQNGDQVGPSPLFTARLSDESGINISGAGIGHDITLTLNDTMTIVLNKYYVADLDSYQSGTIRYPFTNLPTGKYVASLKVWDTYTNFSESTFGFQVTGEERIRLSGAKIYPNPFESELSFEVTHTRPGEDIELILNILLNNGKLLKSLKWQYFNAEATISEYLEAGRLGMDVPASVPLLYQLLIRSLKDSTFDQKSGSLIRAR